MNSMTDGKRPRTKPPETRREELMDAAERLFLRNGVGATTVEQITAAAAVAKGTFYLYFASKDDVRAALGERFAQRHLAHVQAASVDADWATQLKAWARTSVDFYLSSVELHDMLFYEGARRRAKAWSTTWSSTTSRRCSRRASRPAHGRSKPDLPPCSCSAASTA